MQIKNIRQTGEVGLVLGLVVDAMRTLASGMPVLETDSPSPQTAANHRERVLAYWSAAIWVFDTEDDATYSLDSCMAVLNAKGVIGWTPEWMRRKLKEQGHDPFDWRRYVRSAGSDKLGRGGSGKRARPGHEVLTFDSGLTPTGLWDGITVLEERLGRLARESVPDDGASS